MAYSRVRPLIASMRPSGHRRTFFATIALLVLGVAPMALAQTTPKPKKKKGPKTAVTAATTTDDTPPAATTSEPAPTAAPAPTTPAESDTATKPSTTPAEAGTESVAAAYDPDDITLTREDPSRTYMFVGLRYRGTIIPSFIEHLFVNDGATVYSNTIGGEVDWRRDGKSTIAWLQYTEYGFDNTLFLQKGKDDVPQNYSIVNSGLKSIYLGIDEVWSTPIADHFDFEYGFGLGLGAIFGTLQNDWVYQTGASTPGAIHADNGNYYAPCQATSQGPTCTPPLHQNSTETKVGGYPEKNWFNGGSVPVIFPHIAGQLGVRYKPIKQLESRFDLGISLTGFWFGISADYGLEKTPEHRAAKPATSPAKEPKESAPSEDKTSLEDVPHTSL